MTDYEKLPHLMTRKDVAALLGMSWQWVRENEAKTGLNTCRVSWSSNRVRYKRDMAISQLRDVGLIGDGQ